MDGHPVRRRALVRLLGAAALLLAPPLLAACGAAPASTSTAGAAGSASATSSASTSGGRSTVATPSSAATTASTTGVASATANTASAQAATASVTSAASGIMVLAEADANQLKIWQQVATDVRKAHAGIEVSYNNPSDFYGKLDTLIAAGSGPDAVVGMGTKSLPTYVIGQAAALELDSYMARSALIKKSDFFPYAWTRAVLNGHQYGVPQTNSTVALYYNADMFQEAGLPLPPTKWGAPGWTWDDFVQAGRKLAKTSGGKQVWFNNLDTSWNGLLPWVWGNGGHLFNDDMSQVLVDQPPVAAAYQWVADLSWKEHIQPTPDENKASKPSFQNGTLAVSTQTTTIPNYLQTIRGFKWNVGVLPSGSAGVWTRDPSNAVWVWKGSTQVDAAWAFTEYTGGRDAQLTLALGGIGTPMRMEVAHSDQYLHQPNGINWSVYVDALDHEGIQAVTDNQTQLNDTFSKALAPLWTNTATAATIMIQLKPLLEELLKAAKFKRDRAPFWQAKGWADVTA